MTARSRRLGLVVASLIAILAVVVAALPMIQAGPQDFGPTWLVPRPIVIALLLGLPAGLAAIAALRGSRAMLVAAGALCLLQSFVAFSGVTLGFAIPGIVLMGLGLDRVPTGPAIPLRPRERLTGIVVLALAVAAWVVPFATTETVCWTAKAGPDGQPVYMRIPDSGTMEVEVGELGSGCDGGTFTPVGLVAATLLGIGALGVTAGVGGTRAPGEVDA